MKNSTLLMVVFLCALCGSARASDYWVYPGGLGSANGSTSNNAAAWATTSENGLNPGDMLHLCGVSGTYLAPSASGTSVNPITIRFEPGAGMSSPAWTQDSFGKAIGFVSLHDITIDGGVNGYITATANGIGLANQVGCTGIQCFNDCSRIIVKNLAITNMYVFVNGATYNGNGAGGGVTFATAGGNATGNVVSNCVFHDENTGVSFQYGTTWSGMLMTGCTAYNCNFGGSASDGTGSVMTGLVISNNVFKNWQSWDDPADTYHHNGFYAYAVNSGSSLTGLVYVGNTVGPGFSTAGNSTSGLFVSGNCSSLIYNNIFLGTDGTAPANAFLVQGGYLGGKAFNNTFVGGGNGVGLQCSEGTGASQTIYTDTNNLFLNVVTYIAQYNNVDFTYVGGCNLFYGGSSTPFNLSTGGTGNPISLATWVASFDANHQTGNPLLNSTFVPQPGSAAIGTGAGGSLPSYIGAFPPSPGVTIQGGGSLVLQGTNAANPIGVILQGQ